MRFSFNPIPTGGGLRGPSVLCFLKCVLFAPRRQHSLSTNLGPSAVCIINFMVISMTVLNLLRNYQIFYKFYTYFGYFPSKCSLDEVNVSLVVLNCVAEIGQQAYPRTFKNPQTTRNPKDPKNPKILSLSLISKVKQKSNKSLQFPVVDGITSYPHAV